MKYPELAREIELMQRRELPTVGSQPSRFPADPKGVADAMRRPGAQRVAGTFWFPAAPLISRRPTRPY
jgi:hypothetical protein